MADKVKMKDRFDNLIDEVYNSLLYLGLNLHINLFGGDDLSSQI